MGIESVILIVLFLFIEGLFTGSEIAIISTDRSFLKEEAAKGKRYAQMALEKLERPERVFATSLTGTDMSVVANTILVTTFFISRYGKYGEVLSVLFLTPLVAIFGEILPKSIFQAYARKLVPFATYFLHFFSYIFAPIVWLVSSLSEFFLKVFRVDVPAKLGVTRDELIHMATEYRRGEDVEELEQKMVGRVFAYSEKKVKDVMVPLVDVVCFSEDTPIRDAVQVASVRGFSRYPLFSGRIDNVTGFINVLDAFTVRSVDLPVSKITRKALFVPEAAPIDELLETLKKESMPMGIVVDEHGGVTGIITIEDILEEVVGEIEDEFDRAKFYSRKEAEGVYVVSGKAPIAVVENLLKVEFGRGDFQTISGYIMEKCGCIPPAGEIIEEAGVEIKVVGTSEKTIDLVRVRRIDGGDREGD